MMDGLTLKVSSLAPNVPLHEIKVDDPTECPDSYINAKCAVQLQACALDEDWKHDAIAEVDISTTETVAVCDADVNTDDVTADVYRSDDGTLYSVDVLISDIDEVVTVPIHCGVRLTKRLANNGAHIKSESLCSESVEHCDRAIILPETEVRLTERQGTGTTGSQKDVIVHECRRCMRRFSTGPSLAHHMRSTCRNTMIGSGQYVQKHKSSIQTLRKRAENVCNNQFLCDICGKKCKNSSEHQIHVRKHYNDQSYKFGKSTETSTKISHQEMNAANKPGEGVHACGSCGKTFVQLSSMNRHIKEVHATERSYKCKICDETFSRNAQLRRHVRTHDEWRPFSCDVCGKDFMEKRNLEEHSITHSGERPHACEHCGKTFVHLCSLKRHRVTHVEAQSCEAEMCADGLEENLVQLRHDYERPHQCEICEKRFSQLSYLKQHARMHSGEGSFVCDICGKILSQRRHLQEHQQTHSGEKTHECDLCGNMFVHLSSLRRHKLMHTGERPFACDMCGINLKRLGDLNKHKRVVHAGDKRYACEVCGKRFGQSNGLTAHRRIHAREKPYACGICDRKFTQLNHLKTHGKTHRDEPAGGSDDDDI